MERDVELVLTRQVATLDATVNGMSRRLDEQARTLSEILREVKTTNGRVTTLEGVNRERDRDEAAHPVVQIDQRGSVITVSDLKWWIAIAVGCLTAGAGVTVWILQLVGKL